MIPKKTLCYGSKAVESVPRLALTAEWAGNQGAILPCGLQLKAPGLPTIDKSTALRGRVVGAQIDLQRVLEWRKICSETHGNVCTPPQIRDETSELTIRVIDVEQLCVVNLPKDCEYVVLSYVWGKTAQLRLLRENYESLTQPFALRALLDTLLRTIVDATTLVRQLGERFLWVDSLYIIQDSPEDLAVQIQHMNIVYGCASLTIVAAAGSDSDAGLPGLRPNSRKILDIDQLSQPFPISPIALLIPCGNQEDGRSKKKFFRSIYSYLLSTRLSITATRLLGVKMQYGSMKLPS